MFLFLAGTRLVLSIERKRAAGASAWSVDGDLLVRGALILAVELLFINLFWAPGVLVLQVLYAIGASMLCMIALWRLPDALLIAFALAGPLIGEWTRTGALFVPPEPGPAALGLFVNGAWLPVQVLGLGNVLVIYPVLPSVDKHCRRHTTVPGPHPTQEAAAHPRPERELRGREQAAASQLARTTRCAALRGRSRPLSATRTNAE